MIETLYNMLGNAPVVGQPITLAYLGSRVKKSVTTTKDKKLDPKTAEMAGDQLDSYLQDQANDIFDSEVQPYISKTNLPQEIVTPLKEKAIEELTSVLKEKAVTKMTTTA
ncbi:MAG TPA: hypothetical protein VNB90_17040 [Cytophagaceae bacterium]|nr:hypothetical protein [Cytophagaceae bacterium]